MFAEYSRPIEFFNLLDNNRCFLRKPDDKFIKYVREFLKNPEQTVKWYSVFKKFIEKEYLDFIVSQSVTLDKDNIPHPSNKKGVNDILYKVESRDYLIKIYMYDSRFGERCVMSGEQMLSLSISDSTFVLTVNNTFIDHEVLHSSEEELEQRSLDFIRADLEGDMLFVDGEDDFC